MVFERFTWPARRVILTAQAVAREARCQRIETHHLLVALAAAAGTDSSRALEDLGISEAELRTRAARCGKSEWRSSPAHIPFAERSREAIEAAVREADRRGDPELRSGDLLAGLAGNEYCTAGRILADLGVGRQAARAAVERASRPAPAMSAAELADARLPGIRRDDAGARNLQDSMPQADREGDVTVRVECSATVGAPASERAWPMLSSPAAWSLRRESLFMFDVPGAARLRFCLSTPAEGIGCAVFEVRDEVPGRVITLQEHAPGRQVCTLSVIPGRRGRAEVRIAVSMVVQRLRKATGEKGLRHELQGWLSSVREVIEGRAPWPGGGIPAQVHAACLAPRRMEQHLSLSATVLIDAEPDVVWESVHSPDTARLIGPRPAAFSGYLPGAPTGQAGEMQYFIWRQADELFRGSVIIVTEYADQASAVTRRIEPPHDEWSYLLTGLARQTRLEVVYRRPILTRDEETEKREMADEAQSLADGYKTIIEGSAEGDVIS